MKTTKCKKTISGKHIFVISTDISYFSKILGVDFCDGDKFCRACGMIDDTPKGRKKE